MKVLYTSDLHGEIQLFQELLTLAISSSTEIIVLGGDLLPVLPSAEQYENLILNQKNFIEHFLNPYFHRILEATPAEKIFLIPGNRDPGYPYIFKEPEVRIIDLDRKKSRLRNGYDLIGYPFVPVTPFRIKDYEKMDDLEMMWPPQKNPSFIRSSDQPDQLIPVDPYLYLRGQETIRKDLDRLPKPFDHRKAVYIMHSPPLGTSLDWTEGGKQVGSRSIRAFIEKNQPLLTLHGHIHESPELSGAYLDRIGETLCINPGQLGQLQRDGTANLHAVTFEMENLEATVKHTKFSLT